MKSKQSEKQPELTGKEIKKIQGLENISDEVAEKMATTIKKLAEMLYDEVAKELDLGQRDSRLPFHPPKF